MMSVRLQHQKSMPAIFLLDSLGVTRYPKYLRRG
jgi:hypothetical protein